MIRRASRASRASKAREMDESCDLLRLYFRSVGAGASRCRAQRFGKVASFADANVLVVCRECR